MIGDILVGIALRFSTNGVLTMEKLAAATKNANITLLQQQGIIDKNTAALERQNLAISRAAGHWRQMRAMYAGIAAGAGTWAIGASINEAAKLELAMRSVQIATGANQATLRDMQRLVIHVSGITAQNATIIGSELAAAASAGLNDPTRLKTAFPQIARAADVLMLSPKHLDPVTSVTQLSKLSHLFGAYSGKPLHDMLDYSARLMFTQPESLEKLIAQGRLFIPMSLAAGIPMKEIFTEMMSMGQTGLLTGRGGSGMARYIQYMLGASMMTSHMSKARRAAMISLGLFDSEGHNRFVHDGALDMEGSLRWLRNLRGGSGYSEAISNAFGGGSAKDKNFVSDVFSAFLQQGGYFATALTNPAAWAQRSQNQRAFNRIAPPGQAIEKMWDLYVNNTLVGAWRKFWTNIVNVGIGIFFPVLPMFTTFFNTLASVLSKWADWLQDHPKMGFEIAVTAMGAVAALAVYAAHNLWQLNRSILALGNVAAVQNARSGGSALQQFLFGSPFVPSARNSKGQFIAGTMRRSTPGMLGAKGIPSGNIGNFLKYIFDVLPIILTRFIPAVAIAAAALFNAKFMFLDFPAWISHVDLGKTIAVWWNNNRYSIGYAIGYAFGAIGRMLVAAITSLASTAQWAMSNIWMAAVDPNSYAKALGAQLQLELSKQKGTLGQGWATGLGAGYSGGQYGGYTVHINGMTVQMPPGVDKKTFWDIVTHPPQSRGGGGGFQGSNAWFRHVTGIGPGR